MKVIRVKAKVATKPVIEDAAFWKRAAEQNAELAKQFAAELDIEKENHALATAGVQMWQKIADEKEAEARKWETQVHIAQKEIDGLNLELVECYECIKDQERFIKILKM